MYESFYNLTAKPFRLSPDPSFFYASRGHKRALAYLRYGLSQGEGFVVITGAPGTGKTTLAQILLGELNQQDLVVAHLTTTQLQADDMLRMVVASFGLRYQGLDKAAILKTLEAFLLARSRERKRALLVVDEAQNLPATSLEELRMLSNLQVGDHALLQTFLLGQPQFRQMLDHPDLEQLRQRVIANYHLGALAPDECKEYIESRLIHVGWANDPHFTAQVYERIHEYTEGVPRRINMLCDRILLFSSLEERHEVDEATLREVTDELGEEVSGKPVPALSHADEELANASPRHKTSEKKAAPAVEDERAITPQSEQSQPEPDVSGDESAGSENAAEEPADISPTDIDLQDPESEVFELLSAEESLHAEKPMTGNREEASDDDSLDGEVMDRAEPDSALNQPLPKKDPAEKFEEDEPQATAEKTQHKDKLRVIAGGKDSQTLDDVAADANLIREPVVLAPLPDAPGDSEEVVTRKILRLVLAFHRSPRSFPGLDDPSQPLPKGIRNILQLAVAEDRELQDLRQLTVMGIAPAMLRAAVRFFVRRVMFLPGGDDLRILGLQRNASLAEVEVNYGLLMRLMRNDKLGSEDSGVARIGDAYERLCRGDVTGGDEGMAKRVPDEQADSDIEELDLDLAPGLKRRNSAPVRMAQGAGEVADVATAHSGGALTRNVVLVSALVVVTMVLVLSQYRGLDELFSRFMSQARTLVTDSAQDNSSELKLSEQDDSVMAKPSAQQAPVNAGSNSMTEQVGRENASPKSIASQATSALTEDAKPGPADEIDMAAVAEAEAEQQAEKEQMRARAEAEAAALEKAKQRAKAEAESRAAAERKAKADAERKAKMEAERKAKLEAERKAKQEADKRAKLEAEAKAARAEDAKTKLTAEQALTTNTPEPAIAMQTSGSVATKAPQVTSLSLEERDLSLFIQRFQNAYSQGRLDALMSMFAQNARTDREADIEGIRADYQRVFSSSVQRRLTFQRLRWKKESGYAVGSGQFEAMVRAEKNGEPYRSSGSVLIQIEPGKMGLQITRLYFTEIKSIEPGLPNGSLAFSQEELNGVVASLVQSYEKGDIDKFIGLFADNASTNERTNLQDIRSDYVALFQNTQRRSMKLDNLQWDLDELGASAEGSYEVEVQPVGKSTLDRYNGTLWIQLERQDGAPRISNFVFAE